MAQKGLSAKQLSDVYIDSNGLLCKNIPDEKNDFLTTVKAYIISWIGKNETFIYTREPELAIEYINDKSFKIVL